MEVSLYIATINNTLIIPMLNYSKLPENDIKSIKQCCIFSYTMKLAIYRNV